MNELIEANRRFPLLGTNNMVWGPHPYAHLTDNQKNLFFAFIQCPHEDFEFDLENWVIRSRMTNARVRAGETIEFSSSSDYLVVVWGLVGNRRVQTWDQAVRFGSRLLDMPSAMLSINSIVRGRSYGLELQEAEIEVNWRRDGF